MKILSEISKKPYVRPKLTFDEIEEDLLLGISLARTEGTTAHEDPDPDDPDKPGNDFAKGGSKSAFEGQPEEEYDFVFQYDE